MISGIIIAKDEEDTIAHAISSLKFCSEIIVIDNDSSDHTVKAAKRLGARVVSIKNQDFSYRRNKAMKIAKHEWLFYLDVDEEVPTDLAQEIEQVVKNSKHVAYAVPREDVFWKTKLHHGEVGDAYKRGIIRLMRKNCGTWKGYVHEEFYTKKSVGRLHHALVHASHEGIADFLDTINFYSTLRAEELFKKHHSTNVFDILFTPFLKFTYTFFIKAGFRDGPAGFVYSFMMSFHSFLVRSKLYLLRSGVKKK